MRSGHLVLATLVAAVYAACFVLIKLGLADATPLRFAGWRAFLAGGTLLVVLAVSGRPILPPRRLRPWVPVLGAVLTLHYAAMFLSPGRAGAGLSSVLANTGPILLVLLAPLLLRERITRVTAAAVLLGSAGVVLIAWPRSAAGTAIGTIGIMIPLVSAFSSATETALFKRLDTGDALLSIAAWQLTLGALPLLTAARWLEPDRGLSWTPAFTAALTFLAVPGTAFALVLWYWLVQREPVQRLAGFMFLVPMAGLALAWVFFGESVSGLQAAGVALTMLGIMLALGIRPVPRPAASLTMPASKAPQNASHEV